VHIGDEYFLGSSDKSCYFLKEKAVSESSGELTVDKKSIYKQIGYHLHGLFIQGVFKLSRHETALLEIWTIHPEILPSIDAYFKQPKIGGQSTPRIKILLYTISPLSTTGFWFAIRKIVRTLNGCMYFVPVS
jgi:hypothetical protein